MDLKEVFLQEAGELLEQMEKLVLDLEKAATPQILEELFRVAHTLKGSAGVTGVAGVRELSHQLEELLDSLRSGSLEMSTELADLLLAGFDALRALLAGLAEGKDEPPPPELLEKIAGFSGKGGDSFPGEGENGMPCGKRQEEEGGKKLFAALSEDEMLRLEKALAEGRNVFYLELDFDRDFFQRGHNLEYLLEDLAALGEIAGLRVETGRVPPLSMLSPEDYYLFLSLFLLTAEESRSVREVFTFVLDDRNRVGIRPVTPDDLGGFPGAGAREPVAALKSERVREVLQQQAKALSQAGAEVLPGLAASVRKILNRIASSFGFSLFLPEEEKKDPQEEKERLFRAIARLTAFMGEMGGREKTGEEVKGEKFRGNGDVCAQEEKKTEEIPCAKEKGPAEVTGTCREKAQPQSFFRVGQETAEALLGLAGELIIAKNTLPYFIRNLEGAGRDDLARELKEKYGYLDRIARELQERVMDIWLLPIAQIFDRFPRFVRDYSKKTNKKIDLVFEGKQTRLDRNILENIYEPLLHIVRNALDHGLEDVPERRRKGKKEEGRLLLRAFRSGERVLVQVIDDGRGIDAGALAEKAVSAGLLSPERAAGMSRAEKVNLVFVPGLSTREAVSDISGRGVGMDVVKETMERLGGTVQVESEPDRGTTVTLTLPFTLMTNEVLLVKVGGGLYGVPLAAVRETVRHSRAGLKSLRRKALAVLRGELVPVVFVHRYTGDRDSGEEETTLVVLGCKAALAVDRVLGKEEVIVRPLSGELKKVQLFSGAAVLGDGRVLLVLEPNFFAKEASQR
jgi:two-component system chemotaxis sensor kinase CheA